MQVLAEKRSQAVQIVRRQEASARRRQGPEFQHARHVAMQEPQEILHADCGGRHDLGVSDALVVDLRHRATPTVMDKSCAVLPHVDNTFSMRISSSRVGLET